jgi:alkanesulfonate monooxygenase SsuD/methylene tetrahydromethanopterin reductase-like flavin-dependent oxidoreductase (luciferase family)
VSYQGEHYTLPLPDGPGKALRLGFHPPREAVPIYLAAVGPKNTTLAAEIADGWMPFMFSPEHLDDIKPLLDDGFARAGAGKGYASFDIAPTLDVFISDDLDAARDAMRPVLALYIGGMGSRDRNFYNQAAARYGFEDAARRVQDLYLDGRREEAAAALPGELIDLVSLCGPADRVRDRVRALEAAGVGTLIASPMAWTFEERRDQLRRLAELAG